MTLRLATAGAVAAVLTLGACGTTYIDTSKTVPPTGDVATTTLPPVPPGRRSRRAGPPGPDGPGGPPGRARPDVTGDDAGADEEPAPRSPAVMIILTVIAVALVTWSASCLIDVENPYVAAASALSPAITVLAVPVVALGVGRRHPVPAALSTVAAALPWVLVAGYGAPGPGPTTPQAGASVRILTINANGGGADPGRIAQLAQDNTADVVVVTELTSRLAHDLTIAGLNNVVTARRVEFTHTGGDGNGIWTAPELDGARRVPDLSRPAVSGVLATGAGPVGVVAAHAAGTAITPGAGWRADLERLPGLVPETPDERGIIIGDFNTTPWSPAFRRLASGGWRDAADVVGRGLRPTWPSWTPLPVSPLDHVLVSGGLGVSEVNAADVPGSKHRALLVTVVVPPKQTR